MKNKLDIWWKLALISLCVNLVSTPMFLLFKFWGDWVGKQQELSHLAYYGHYAHIFITFLWVLIVPMAYFVLFCIWHWHTRFKGKHPVFWPIFSIVAYWMSIPGSFFISLVYFFSHILPDLRKKGAYSPSAKIPMPHLPVPLPAHCFAKSVCLSLGWSIIVIGLFAAITLLIADFVIWNIALGRIPQLVGEPFTKKFADAFIGFVHINKVCVVTSFLCAVTTVIGAIFLQIGYKLKPAKMDETKKDMERIEECGNKDG